MCHKSTRPIFFQGCKAGPAGPQGPPGPPGPKGAKVTVQELMTEFLDIVKGSLESVIFFFNRFINTNAISFIKQKRG